MNPYDEPLRRKRSRRMIVEYPLRTPDPANQPALPLDPPQPAQQDLTISARFWKFHRANPHVYASLREMALAEAELGVRRISPKLLVERLRALGTPTASGDDIYQINNIFTSHYARLLAAEPGLTGRIPMRKLVAE